MIMKWADDYLRAAAQIDYWYLLKTTKNILLKRKGMHVADWLITIPAHLSATSRIRDYYRSKFTDRDRKKIF